MELFDTHCHVQSVGGPEDDHVAKKWRDGGVDNLPNLFAQSVKSGVNRWITVGTHLEDSIRAVDVAKKQKNCWASVGIHPHEAVQFLRDVTTWQRAEDEEISPLKHLKGLLDQDEVVAVGEVGLDYFYEHSDKTSQKKLLEQMLQMAQDKNLPVILHVREAHSDFWPIFDKFKIRGGVLHSFSATTRELEEALKRNLHIGLNGIMTFTSDEKQLEAARKVPLDRLLLETDAPYLTPKPFRGKVCTPMHVKNVAEFLAQIRGEPIEKLAEQTTMNALRLINVTGKN